MSGSEPEARPVSEAALVNPYFSLFTALASASDEIRLSARKAAIWAYAWAVPTDAVARRIAELSPILEVGAGTGYWAWLLAQAGALVEAVDVAAGQAPTWLPTGVEAGIGNLNRNAPARAEARRSGPDPRALLLCWPPYESPMASDTLRQYTGRHVIYVGEWRGRTADAVFHDALDRDWVLEGEHEIPCWPGFRDRVFIFKRV